MAVLLEEFDWSAFQTRSRQTYNYDEIFDGHIRRYVKGEDFKCLAKSFQQNLLKNAKDRKIVAKAVIVDDNTVVAGKIG